MDTISGRLLLIMDYFGLTATAFADRTGVQRSGISHLLSGRNKPSLDFVVKLIDAFPEIDLYWLLTGAGSMIKNDQPAASTSTDPDKVDQPKDTVANASENDDVTSRRIVIFNSDGTYSEYFPKP